MTWEGKGEKKLRGGGWLNQRVKVKHNRRTEESACSFLFYGLEMEPKALLMNGRGLDGGGGPKALLMKGLGLDGDRVQSFFLMNERGLGFMDLGLWWRWNPKPFQNLIIIIINSTFKILLLLLLLLYYYYYYYCYYYYYYYYYY